MRFRVQPWAPVAGLAVLCALAIWGLIAYRNWSSWNAADMASALPEENAVMLYVDLNAIRKTSVFAAIAGTKSVEELDYRKFVNETGFDYKTDLDRVLISFLGRDRYAVAVGRFNWPRIRGYAGRSGASCINAVCEVPGAALENRVSFYPLQDSTMALASTPLEGGVSQVAPRRNKKKPVEPWPLQAPVWIRIPGSVWRDASKFPTGAKIFASALGQAQQTLFTVEPGADENHLALKMRVACENPQDATKILQQIEEATALLRKMLQRDGLKPKPDDLAGLLISGTFKMEGVDRVLGEWPLETALIRSIAEGNVE
jgi:hypothetical protein